MRNKHWWTWIAATVVSLGCVSDSTTAGEPVRIMPLGDSITAGSDGGYRTLLFNTLNEAGHTVDFVGSSRLQKDRPQLADSDHEGHGGWRINTIQRNITDWIAEYQPNVILLHIGTNDISTGQWPLGLALELSGLLETLYTASPEVTVYVASIILRTDDPERIWVTERYAALTPLVVQAWADQGYDARFVDMHAAIGPEDLADALHPNQQGYDKMALVWAQAYDGTIAELPLSMTIPRAGQPATLTVRNAAPGEEVRFYATTGNFGSTPIKDLGVSLDILWPMYLGSAWADEHGEASFTATVDPDYAQETVRIQAAAAGRTSQVLIKIVRG